MKRLISVVLVLVLVLSVGTMAFADSKTANITKSPTDEVRYVGDTAIFKSAATGYDKLTWNFESPDKKAVTVQEFKARFPYAVVEGENTTTLTVKNVSTDMNGWAVYCTFFSGETEVSTTLAFLYVTVSTAPVTPAPKPTTTTTTTYYTYYVPVYDEYEYVFVDDDDDDDVYVYVDEFGTYTPAHPDAYDYDFDYDDGTWVDEFGTFTPAHPDAYDYDFDYSEGTWEDDYGTYTPAHPDAFDYDDFLFED